MKQRASRNRTLTMTHSEMEIFRQRLLRVDSSTESVIDKTINQDLFEVLDLLPKGFADLIIIDPPYNLTKDFNAFKFRQMDEQAYLDYLRSWFPKVVELLKPTGSLYICCDWRSTSAIYRVVEEFMVVKNRITWQREKGRGAKSNWKNGMEDIWFAVKDDNSYYFDVEAVKQKRRVMAPYKVDGQPKDWEQTEQGKFRLTCPSNFWDDITIPYWSMAENTDHPTQKPEKLIAKLILASCPEGGVVFDPFLGSGTTSVVAKKLGRRYCGVELNEEYAIWAEKRLDMASEHPDIQGYSGGVFWERNTAHRVCDSHSSSRKR